MIKVAMLSLKDYAGSGYRMCQAAKMYGIDAKLCVHLANVYGYSSDYQTQKNSRRTLYDWLREADIIHFKGDDLPTEDFHGIRIPKNKPWIVTVGGSGFRRLPYRSRCSKPFAKIEDYLKVTDYRTTITPDLNYPEFKAEYIPHCYDGENYKNMWKPRTPLLIAHSPSLREKKGTNIFGEALKMLKAQNVAIDTDLIENVSNAECILRKSASTLFVDQIADTGFYGMSGIEAMAMGIPTIARISMTAIEQAEGKIDRNKLPIIKVTRDAEDVFEMFLFFCKYPDKLKALSTKTKRWADTFHSMSAVGKRWAEIYKQLAR